MPRRWKKRVAFLPDPVIEMEETAPAEIETRSVEPNAPELHSNSSSTIPADELERLTGDIIAALKTVYDPEIPADIYEIGLIYRIDIEDDRTVRIDMTLTAPGCPVAGEMPGWVRDAVSTVPGVMDVEVNMVFEPPWTPERMSEEAQIALGWY